MKLNKKLKYILSSIGLIGLVVVPTSFVLTSCTENITTSTDGDNTTSNDEILKLDFLWNQDDIVGLSEQGKSKENLIVPSFTTSISGLSSAQNPNTTLKTINLSKCNKLKSFTFSYCNSLESIDIPNNITSIDANAFLNCLNLTNIRIPESVISIGDSAFYGCSNLTNITISSSVTSIGEAVFSSCLNLKNVDIVDGVTSIGPAAFSGCSNLLDICIYKGVKNIGASAFENCSSLTSITIPDGVNKFGVDVFSGNNPTLKIKFSFKETMDKFLSINSSWEKYCEVISN